MPDHSTLAPTQTAAILALLIGLGAGAGGAAQTAPAVKAQAPKAVRLYVFDCGLLNITAEGVQRYHVTPTEVGETRMSVPCFLVAHPRGTLMWDLGVIRDTVVGAWTHARAPGVDLEARFHGPGDAERGSVSLRAGADVPPGAARQRVRRRAVGGVADDDRGISAKDEDDALDRA